MILLLRGLARLIGFLLLIVLALLGLAVLVLAITGGSPDVAASLGLPSVRDGVGSFLASLEAGDASALAVLGLIVAVLVGIAILVGALVSPRERLFLLQEGEGGRLTARRRAVWQAATVLTEREREVTDSSVKARPARHGSGGKLTVKARTRRPEEREEAARRATAALEPVTSAFGLTTQVTAQAPDTPQRVR